MQTILGSGGAIGVGLARELTAYTKDIRLVSRNPKKVNPDDQLFPADLSDPSSVDKAIQGSDIVYLTIGFEYKLSLLKQKWPPLINHVIDACKRYNAKLVFFDNVYMYDPDYIGNMTEETPVKPSSEKGKIRAAIADKIMKETKNGLTALIARSADFYGPSIRNSVMNELVYKNFKKGKAANWMASVNKIHNFTYTPDAAKATAMLGNTPDCYNQVWHLPTDATKMTAKEWIELFAKEMKISPKYFVLPSWLLSILGIFIPLMKELKEMNYQNERDYFFNSSKFENYFNFKPTTPETGVRNVIKVDTEDL